MNAVSNALIDSDEGSGNLKGSSTNVKQSEGIYFDARFLLCNFPFDRCHIRDYCSHIFIESIKTLYLGSETGMTSLPRHGVTYKLVLNNISEINECSTDDENTLKSTLPIAAENSTISTELPNAIANAMQSTTKVVLLLTNSSTAKENCIQTDLSDQNQEINTRTLDSTRNQRETSDTKGNNDVRLNSVNQKIVTTEAIVKRNRGRPRKERTYIEDQSSCLFRIFILLPN